MSDASQSIFRFGHKAMTTVFEIIIASQEERYASQAATAACAEVDRIESLLSRFDPGSDISQINHLVPGDAVRVTVDTFECLRIAQQMHDATGGAFDVTVGPLISLYRTVDGGSRTPSQEEIEAARLRCGMQRLVLDDGVGGESPTPENSPHPFTVTVVAVPGSSAADRVEVDLGGIGKGFALDRAAEVLTDWGIDDALIHGGASTALAIGSGGESADCPPGRAGWPVAAGGDAAVAAGQARILLHNRALSGSGTDVKGAHVLDPRTGRAAEGHAAAWATAPNAAQADALSTAFMVMNTESVRALCDERSEFAALLIEGGAPEPRLLRLGEWEILERP